MRVFFGCGLALALPALVSAQTAIAGRVVDAGTGQPLSGVAVRLAGPPGQAHVTESDAEGRFRIDGASPGSYRTTALRSGYEPGRGPTLEVTGREKSQDLSIELNRSVVITGRVLDHAGRPVVAAQVSAYEKRFDLLTLEPIWDRFDSHSSYALTPYMGVTDDRGEYRLWGLPAGEYVLAAASTPRHGPRGRVLWTSAPALHPNASSFDEAARLRLDWAEVREGVDIRLAPPSPTRQTITILNSEEPCDRCYGALYRTGGESDVRVADVRPSARGELVLEGLPPGEYQLGLAFRSGIGPGRTAIGSFPISSERDRPVTIELSRPVAVRGRVVFEDPPDVAPEPPRQNPRFPQFNAARLGPLAREQEKVFFSCRSEPAVFSGDGGERVFDLSAAPGRCQLSVNGPPDSYLASLSLDGRPLAELVLDVPPDGLAGELVARFRFDLGEISGRVEGPAEDAWVVFLPAERQPFRGFRPVRAEPDGSFRAKLPPGRWHVLAVRSPGPVLSPGAIAKLSSRAGRAERVDLEAGQSSTLSSELPVLE